MTELTNPIAELNNPDSGKLIKPENAHKIKSTEKFYCPDHDCLDENRVLIVAKSKNGVYFFKHKPKFKHEIRPQTLLHKMAVKWFENIDVFEIPEFKTEKHFLSKQELKINPKKTELEYQKLKLIIPDVKLITESEFEFAIEIFVTSDINENKSKLINEFGLPTLRIDLSKFYKENPEKCRTDYEFIESNLNGLLNDINLKSWEILPTQEQFEDKIDIELITEKEITNENEGCLISIFVLGLFYLIFRKKKR